MLRLTGESAGVESVAYTPGTCAWVCRNTKMFNGDARRRAFSYLPRPGDPCSAETACLDSRQGRRPAPSHNRLGGSCGTEIWRAGTGRGQAREGTGGLGLPPTAAATSCSPNPERGTWYAFRVNENTFGIFDTFEHRGETGRRTSTGRIPAALGETRPRPAGQGSRHQTGRTHCGEVSAVPRGVRSGGTLTRTRRDFRPNWLIRHRRVPGPWPGSFGCRWGPQGRGNYVTRRYLA